METTNVSTEENLYCFLEERGANRVERELLAFWGRHSDAKFSRRVICYALDCSKLEAEEVLRATVEEGLLDKHITNGVTLYSLTRNEEKRRPVVDLAALGWDQWQHIVRHIKQRDKLVKEMSCKRVLSDG